MENAAKGAQPPREGPNRVGVDAAVDVPGGVDLLREGCVALLGAYEGRVVTPRTHSRLHIWRITAGKENGPRKMPTRSPFSAHLGDAARVLTHHGDERVVHEVVEDHETVPDRPCLVFYARHSSYSLCVPN
jgi:hypothetical protein